MAKASATKPTNNPTSGAAKGTGGKAAEGIVEAVKRPQVTAGPCEKHASHLNTRIYKTAGTTRYAVCDDCGHTWKVVGPRADADKQYLADLAQSLDEAAPVAKGDEQFILLTTRLRKEIVGKLREIAGR